MYLSAWVQMKYIQKHLNRFIPSLCTSCAPNAAMVHLTIIVDHQQRSHSTDTSSLSCRVYRGLASLQDPPLSCFIHLPLVPPGYLQACTLQVYVVSTECVLGTSSTLYHWSALYPWDHLEHSSSIQAFCFSSSPSFSSSYHPSVPTLLGFPFGLQ